MNYWGFSQSLIEIKEILKKIKWEASSALADANINNEEKDLINIFLKKIDKINSKLNNYKRNLATLDEYVNDLKEMSGKKEYLKEYGFDIKEIMDLDVVLTRLINESLDDFSKLNFFEYLHDLSYLDLLKNINSNSFNELDKYDFDLNYVVSSSKELIEVNKDLILKYRNNIKMLPVYEKSKKTIENNLLNYIDDKKIEIDRFFKSLQEEILSTKSNIKLLDLDVEKIKSVNSELKENNFEIDTKINSLYQELSRLESIYKVERNRLDKELKSEVENARNLHIKSFENKLIDFNKELDSLYNEIWNEINSIKDTSQSFKDFISDETSIKLTNDYRSKAKWEMISYYFFNALSFSIIMIAFIISWYSLTSFAEAHVGLDKSYNSNDLVYLSIRLIFSLLVFSSVTFTSRLASKSYTYWKKNEGIYLRLTALKSFIADLPDSKKELIHEKLVDVYFGKDEQDQNINYRMKDLPTNITQLLGKIVDQTTDVLDMSKRNDSKTQKNKSDNED